MALALKKLPYVALCTLLLRAVVTKCGDADVLKTIEKFPNLTALHSTTADLLGTNLECATLQLTHFDAQDETAAYTWYLKTDNSAAPTFVDQIRAGDSPYEVKVVSTPDPETVWTATLPFTDEKTCFILKREDKTYACILWVSTDSVDNVSEQCIQENEKICGEGVVLYDKDTCGGNTDN
ncbi:uncharacterized protein LOC144152084 [Haemaphysalis longicornis]